MHILIIEDVRFISLLVENQLNAIGHKATIAANGYDALEYLENDSSIGLVISDLQLPDMTGLRIFEECQNIQKFKTRAATMPPFVLLTASKNHQDLVEAEAMGFIAALNKPLDIRVLQDIITAIDNGNTFLKEGAPKTKGKILVVDSLGKITPAVQNAMTGSGYTLLFAANSTECHNYLREYSNVQMVISDLDLKDGNAINLIKTIREQEDQLPNKKIPPFVIVTESNNMDMLQIARLSGFSEVITAPFDKFIIKQKVNRVFMQEGNTDTDYKTILLIDDINFHCVMTRAVLNHLQPVKSGKYNILIASCGSEALDYLKSDPSIALVVSDYYLPDINGIDIFKEFSHVMSKNKQLSGNNYQLPPFVLLTISSDETIKNAALSAGFKTVFTKPLEAFSFLTTVSNLLETPQPSEKKETADTPK